jgi:hypothetical protein
MNKFINMKKLCKTLNDNGLKCKIIRKAEDDHARSVIDQCAEEAQPGRLPLRYQIG